MDAMITTMIAPVMMKGQKFKEDNRTRRSDSKSKAKKPEHEADFDEEFAAIYQHDPYAELSGITYKRPRVKGY